MLELNYIVVPVDFSPASQTALDLARELAADRTKLEALYVVDRWPRFMDNVLFPYAPLGEDAAEIEHELAKAAAKAITRFQKLGNDVDSTVEVGATKRALPELLRARPCDLVVMGAVGESGVLVDSLGSVAERATSALVHPTLLTRPSGSGANVERVLAAVDLGPATVSVLRSAIGVALAAGAELSVLHVIPDPLADDTNHLLEGVLRHDPSRTVEKLRDRIEALFDRAVKELGPAFGDAADVASLTAQRTILLGNPADVIVEHANDCGADVLAVGHHAGRAGQHRIGRVAATILRRALCHTLIVPISSSHVAEDDG